MPNNDGVPIIGYCLLDQKGGIVAARNADVPFYAASTIKLGVMLAAILAADAGGVRLDDTVVCRRRFGSGVSGAPSFVMAPDDTDLFFPDDGAVVTIGELIGMMIFRSSNEATDVLVERIGFDAVNDAFSRCGALGTRMERLIGDVAGIAAGLTNMTTPADLAVTMKCIAAGDLASPSGTALMRDVLARQEHLRIGLEVPLGIPWGSKSGDVPGIEHDVAFVGEPGSSGAFFMAICTRGFEPEQGRAIIGGVSSALLTCCSFV